MKDAITVYSFSKCQSCRKTLKWLNDHSIEYNLVDITISPPSKIVLSRILTQLVHAKQIFNTSGASYRKLGAAKVALMSEDQMIHELSLDGKLIKRPLIILSNGFAILGYNPEVFSNYLLEDR